MNPLSTGIHRWSAAGAAAAFGLLWLAPPSFGQLNQQAPVSTEGTQFIPPAEIQSSTIQPSNSPQPPPGGAAAASAAAQVLPPLKAGMPLRSPSVVFLLDTSDSMLDKSPGKDVSHLDEARNAIAEVIRGMPADARVQVWHFNSRMYPIVVGNAAPGTFVPVGDIRQRDELIAKLRGIHTAGPTKLYESVVQALNFFSRAADQALYRNGERFPVLVVVSDGEDTGSSVKLENVQEAKRGHPLVTVNAIGFTVLKDDPWYKRLCQLATSLAGCATADDQGQLRAILENFYRPVFAAR